MTDKKPILTLTAKDFRWDYYNGTGKGGQNRNKKAKCVRCIHEPSKSVGKGEEERSREQNKRNAFVRMASTDSFQKWIKTEAKMKLGLDKIVRHDATMAMKDTMVEIKDENGRWVKAPPDMQVQYIDIHNLSMNMDFELTNINITLEGDKE